MSSDDSEKSLQLLLARGEELIAAAVAFTNPSGPSLPIAASRGPPAQIAVLGLPGGPPPISVSRAGMMSPTFMAPTVQTTLVAPTASASRPLAIMPLTSKYGSVPFKAQPKMLKPQAEIVDLTTEESQEQVLFKAGPWHSQSDYFGRKYRCSRCTSALPSTFVYNVDEMSVSAIKYKY